MKEAIMIEIVAGVIYRGLTETRTFSPGLCGHSGKRSDRPDAPAGVKPEIPGGDS